MIVGWLAAALFRLFDLIPPLGEPSTAHILSHIPASLKNTTVVFLSPFIPLLIYAFLLCIWTLISLLKFFLEQGKNIKLINRSKIHLHLWSYFSVFSLGSFLRILPSAFTLSSSYHTPPDTSLKLCLTLLAGSTQSSRGHLLLVKVSPWCPWLFLVLLSALQLLVWRPISSSFFPPHLLIMA